MTRMIRVGFFAFVISICALGSAARATNYIVDKNLAIHTGDGATLCALVVYGACELRGRHERAPSPDARKGSHGPLPAGLSVQPMGLEGQPPPADRQRQQECVRGDQLRHG